MIVVITNQEINPQSGRKEIMVSHGMDLETDQPVVLPNYPLSCFNVAYNSKLGEYVLHTGCKDPNP